MTLTTKQREEYRERRAAQAYVSAKCILGGLRHEASTEPTPDLNIPTGVWDGIEWEHDGMSFHLKIENDDDTAQFNSGNWTHEEGTDCVDAVDHHKRHRDERRSTYRWWRPESGALPAEHARWYHERGMAKGPAHNLGVAMFLEEYRYAEGIASGNTLVSGFIVTVRGEHGCKLGEASTWGIVGEDRDYARSVLLDLAIEAKADALDELKREASEGRESVRKVRAWELVEQAAGGNNIQIEAAILVAERVADR